MAAGCKFRLLCSESFGFGHRRKFKKKQSGRGKIYDKEKDESAIAAAVAANEERGERGEREEGEEEAEEGRKGKQNLT